MNCFIVERKNNWERLENLLSILETSSLKGLSKMEVREFGELYRRAAADLAIARSETRDPKLINYLNSLVIRVHGKIYLAESQGANLVLKFFSEDFPKTFRHNSRYFVVGHGVIELSCIFICGCACLLVVAGIIEGFLSPSNLPPFIKFGAGILTGIAMYSYLFLIGSEEVETL